MKKYCKKISFIFFLAALVAFLIFAAAEFVTFEALKKNSDELARYVEEHYMLSLLIFATAFISTAFFIPGALILTISGGFLFGAVLGALYASLFSTAGAIVAFLASRYLIGNWIQKHYSKQLERFNQEIFRRGNNYLFVLRIVPVMPFFLVNYLAGLTRISTMRFAAVTFLGILPGAVVYSLAGRQLAGIKDPKDILSVDVLIFFLLLAMFALLPVIYQHVQRVLQRK